MLVRVDKLIWGHAKKICNIKIKYSKLGHFDIKTSLSDLQISEWTTDYEWIKCILGDYM